MRKRGRAKEEDEEGAPSKRHHSSMSDEEDAALAEANLSQIQNFHKAKEEKNATEVGIIEELSLKNFMCHNRLTINFGNNVNYIIGRNGSGKSAILTGLVVGLGGKATATNRGSSVKAFIKNGKSSGEVMVKLRNQGPDAFMPDKYGKSVIVERILRSDGGGGYKLKDHKGKVVSTKREDLNHILDQFNIQVDNPVSVLNQDTSRNFLHSKNPHDRYRFFLRATQLEQLKHDYTLAIEQKEISQEIIRQKQETLPKVQQEVREWENRYKSLQSLDDLRKKVDKLKEEMAWAQVFELEKALDPVKKEVTKENQRTPKYMEKVSQSDEKVKASVEKQKHVQEELKKLNAEAQTLQPEHQKHKKEVVDKKKDHRESQMELRKCQTELRSLTKDRNQILERIEEIKNSAQQDFQDEKVKRQERIAELEAQLAEEQARQRTTQHDLEQYKAAVARLKEDSYRIREEEQELQGTVRRLQADLRNLESSRNNRVQRFGTYMPKLLQRIEEEARRGRFNKKPRGPVGANISLKEQRWALGVESCLGGLMHAFLCHDHADERHLQKLFQECIGEGRKPTIITSKFLAQFHNVSNRRVDHNLHPCVLDMLEVEDPAVHNALVDQAGIENILLIWDNEEAKRLMSTNPPAKCKAAYTSNGDRLVCHPTYRYYSYPNKKASFLTANVEEDIRSRQDELQQVEAQRQQLNQRQQEIQRDLNSNKTKAHASETRQMKLRAAVQKTRFEMNELKNIEDPTPVDVSTLEEDVQKLNEDIGGLENQNASLVSVEKHHREELEAAEQAFRQVDERIRAIADSSTPLQDQLGKVEGEIELAKQHKAHYEKKQAEHLALVESLQTKLENMTQYLEAETAKAEKYCAKVQTRRTPKNLDSEIQQIEKRIQVEEKTKGNREEITNTYMNKLESYKKIKDEVGKLKYFIKTIENIMELRNTQYMIFRRSISIRARHAFIMMLDRRNYNGLMTFDHGNEKLVLDVQPTQAAVEGRGDMKALSGGERSFATVCFILSLWDSMDSPFRCLDEYDIFMDMVNRRISMELMIDMTTKQYERQFIFLTPLDMSKVLSRVGEIRIFRMPDPERGKGTQTVLPFEPVNQEEEERGASKRSKHKK